MKATQERQKKRSRERGISLFLVAVSLVVLAGMAAMAIDLASLYVARNEAQRAADAGALAGAKRFVDSGFFAGFVPQSTAEGMARQEAKTIAAQNLVSNQFALVQDGDVTFDFSNPDNPRITVYVERSAARSNAVPTFFAKALGVIQADVSAAATAEAFAPSAGSLPVGTGCVKPWIMPNCDPNNPAPENPNCPGSAYFTDPITGEVTHPGSIGGVIGTNFILKAGLPSEAPVPGQFYPIQIPPGDEPALCPECASTPGGSEGPGAALYRHNISCCNTNQFVCGQQVEVDEQTGNMVGPTSQGVRCLINQSNPNCGGNPSNCGQDFIPSPDVNPYDFIGGSNNPNPALRGQHITSSPSVVTIPLYEGYPLTPGESGALPLVTITGFLQVFVEKVGPPQSTVTAYIINVAGCGAGAAGGGPGGGSGGGGGGSGGAIAGAAGTPYPVRLVRPSGQ